MPSQVPISDFTSGTYLADKPGPVPMLVVFVHRQLSDKSYLICDHSGNKYQILFCKLQIHSILLLCNIIIFAGKATLKIAEGQIIHLKQFYKILQPKFDKGTFTSPHQPLVTKPVDYIRQVSSLNHSFQKLFTLFKSSMFETFVFIAIIS